MANEERLISGIEKKIQELIELSINLKEENTNLHQHIKVLEEDLRTMSNELEIKRNELLNITLANTLKAEYGVEESKKKIDSLINTVRGIWSCWTKLESLILMLRKLLIQFVTTLI